MLIRRSKNLFLQSSRALNLIFCFAGAIPMKTEEFSKYLTERYEDQINWYDQKSTWNQKNYGLFQWGINRPASQLLKH